MSDTTISIDQLEGDHSTILADKPGWRLWGTLRIDAHGGYSNWLCVENMRAGDVREFPSLAAALRAYNEEGR